MGTPPLSTRLRDFIWSLKENRKATLWIMGAVIIVLLAGVAGISFYISSSSDQLPTAQSEQVNIDLGANGPAQEQVPRFIDGVLVEAGDENIFPIAVMVENLVTVRPQVGLQQANVVYEALAEGGITRFMAVYANREHIPEIGPVRSARHYYVDWAEEYEGIYMHAGGSPQALGQLVSNDYLEESINQIGGNHMYFWREDSIAAPHNLFTSSDMMAYALRDRELYDECGRYNPWKFTSDADVVSDGEGGSHIQFDFSSPSYTVVYDYDDASRQYLRTNGGIAHTDRLTGEQLHVKNVVIQFAPVNLMESDTGRLDISTIGEGRAMVFMNGQGIEGMWKKMARDERTRFYRENGEEIAFSPGNTWVHILPDDRTVEYN